MEGEERSEGLRSSSPRHKRQRSGSRSPGASHNVTTEKSGPLSEKEMKQFELLKNRLDFAEFCASRERANSSAVKIDPTTAFSPDFHMQGNERFMGWSRDQSGPRVERPAGQIVSRDDDEMGSASAVSSVDFIQESGARGNRPQSQLLSGSSAYNTSSAATSNDGVSWEIDRSNSSQPTGWYEYECLGANRAQVGHSLQPPLYTANRDFAEYDLERVYRGFRCMGITVPEY